MDKKPVKMNLRIDSELLNKAKVDSKATFGIVNVSQLVRKLLIEYKPKK